MDARLDPRCDGARALTRQHADQSALLVAGTGGQLEAILRATQTRQLEEHLATCPQCMSFDPRCPHCRFDTRTARHGWMCPAQSARWRDVFPWNWRARYAPSTAPTAPKAGRVPIQVHTGADTRVHLPAGAQPPRMPPMPAGGRAGRAAARAPPAQAGAPSLVRAFAMLGLAPGASPNDARAAYRELAQRYHPDKVAHMAPEFRAVAEKRMSEINAAYEAVRASFSTP